MPGAIELVVTDLDGTLSDAGERVHPRTLAAVRTLATAGVPVLVATGRRLRTAAAVLGAAGLAPPVVVLDGAIGHDLLAGRGFHRAAFVPDSAASVLEAFTTARLEPCVYVDRPDLDMVAGPAPASQAAYLAANRDWIGRADLGQVVATERVLAFAVIGRDARELDGVAAAVARIASPAVTRDLVYGRSTLQVRPPGISKWSGVLAFCADRGLDPGRVLAVGDGANDVELLAAARVACVVRGGCPAALSLADHLIDPPAQGGWAAILDLL